MYDRTLKSNIAVVSPVISGISFTNQLQQDSAIKNDHFTPDLLNYSKTKQQKSNNFGFLRNNIDHNNQSYFPNLTNKTLNSVSYSNSKKI